MRRQDSHHFADILKCIFFLNKISIKFACKGPNDNTPALVWIINQWWPSLLTHVCVIRPQWINRDAGFAKELFKSVSKGTIFYNVVTCDCSCVDVGIFRKKYVNIISTDDQACVARTSKVWYISTQHKYTYSLSLYSAIILYVVNVGCNYSLMHWFRLS